MHDTQLLDMARQSSAHVASRGRGFFDLFRWQEVAGLGNDAVS